jgi:SsrA-binding protein
MHVSPYEQGGRYNVEPLRTRKLLLHRNEIERLRGAMAQKRLTLVPLKLYESRGLAKVELALGRGRREYEKRDRIRKEEGDRDVRQMLRQRQRE